MAGNHGSSRVPPATLPRGPHPTVLALSAAQTRALVGSRHARRKQILRKKSDHKCLVPLFSKSPSASFLCICFSA